MSNNSNQTKWNINLRKNTEYTSNTEPFLVTSNFQQPLLQTLPFLKPSQEMFAGLPYPISTSTIETMGNRSDMGNRTPIPTKEEIAKMNAKVNNCNKKPVAVKPTTLPGQHNYIDPSGSYSLKIYETDTYLNGFKCNDGGCDISGIDIFVNWVNCKGGGCDMSGIDINESDSANIKVNTPKKVYFRDGGSSMIDANKMDLKDVTFGGNTLTNYIFNLKKNSVPQGKFDISSGSYFQTDNTKVNYFEKNPFVMPVTVRTNPLTHPTMNTPIVEGLQNTDSEGTNKLDIKSDGDSKKDFITWWKKTAVPNIIKYNGVALINEGLIYVFNKCFIEIFDGNFQANAYTTVLINYYIFIGYFICIFITYNLFYRFFFNSSQIKSKDDDEEPTKITVLSSIFDLLKKIFFPLAFLSLLNKFITETPLILTNTLSKTGLNKILLDKIIFIVLFILTIYVVLYLNLPYYLATAFLNSLRFGKDEFGKVDIFTHYTMISISGFGIFTTFYNFHQPDIDVNDIKTETVFTILYFLATMLGLLIKLIISISLTWVTVFIMSCIIVFFTVIPRYGFGIIHELNCFFDETYKVNYTPSDNTDDKSFDESSESRAFTKIINFIYNYIFEFGLIILLIFQSIKYGKIINNEYSYFKAMLLSACYFFIIICFLFCSDRIKKGCSLYIGAFLSICAIIVACIFMSSFIYILYKFIIDLI